MFVQRPEQLLLRSRSDLRSLSIKQFYSRNTVVFYFYYYLLPAEFAVVVAFAVLVDLAVVVVFVAVVVVVGD